MFGEDLLVGSLKIEGRILLLRGGPRGDCYTWSETTPLIGYNPSYKGIYNGYVPNL